MIKLVDLGGGINSPHRHINLVISLHRPIIVEKRLECQVAIFTISPLTIVILTATRVIIDNPLDKLIA